jgi:outer membrane protein
MKSKLSIINTLLLVAILAYLFIGKIQTEEGHSSKQAYVITDQLFSEFEYQKELDKEFMAIKDEKSKGLQEFGNQLVELERKILIGQASEVDQQNYQNGVLEYQKVENQINQELLAINSDYNSKIWEKLSAFSKDYGELNEYEVIFGTNGSGNIIHASEEKNITSELVDFCNMKYRGKIK